MFWVWIIVGHVGTLPPDDTWHAFLFGSAPSGSPQEDTWHASPIRTPLGRGTRHSQASHPDDRHITSGRPTYPIRIYLSGSLIDVSKSCTSFRQPATAHVSSPAERKDRNDGTSLPTISNSRDASHNLCQPPVGW